MKLQASLSASVLLLFAPVSACAQAAEWVQSEYGFNVRFPAHATVCDAVSGEHHIGWFLPLEGGCEGATRRIIVLASYNAAFQTSPEASIDCAGAHAKRGGVDLAFIGHRSATCLEHRPDGAILATVATQAWPQPAPSGDTEEDRAPWINYYAYLESTPSRLDEDMGTFRRVVETVKITSPAP